jgi:hypothetical protein
VGNDIAGEILRLARFENVTQIVVGPSHGGFLAELFRRSLPETRWLSRTSPVVEPEP